MVSTQMDDLVRCPADDHATAASYHCRPQEKSKGGQISASRVGLKADVRNLGPGSLGEVAGKGR
jgi:hypothetical protein